MPINSNVEVSDEFSNPSASFAPRMGSLLAALVATLAVYFFRAHHSSLPLRLILETILFTSFPLVALVRRRTPELPLAAMSKTTLFRFQVGAILTGAIVVVWHIICRQYGLGSAYEIIALLTIQNVGWYLAVFSKVPGFKKMSFVLCGFTAFFVCCVTDQTEIFLITGAYAFVSLWWLLGQYWNRLDTKTIDGRSRSLRLHGGAISITTIAVGGAVCLTAAIPFSKDRIPLPGFMPFSGGENGYDDLFANSGIGDGNMLAAGNNATTTGAVDSSQVIEGHERSLYDAVSEQYNGPVKKVRRRGKAMSLSSVAKHLDGAKQSEQSGKTFRTLRNTNKRIDRDYEDRITEALFFVEGSAPARFVVNTFDHFDGWDWSRDPSVPTYHPPPSFELDKRQGPDVFSVDKRAAAFLTNRRSHCVKIMRFESDVIPAPALLQRWRIPQVDRPDMFLWNDAGLLCLDNESIPSQTMIFLESLVPNYHLLRSAPKTQQASADSPFLQTPKSPGTTETNAIAIACEGKSASGWEQVEAIVSHVRGNFKLKPSWEPNLQVNNSVHEFIQQRGGPSYMFATTCAMALRSAGYETRIANGFLIQKSDYDSKSNQSIVTSDNLHIWPEVCLDGKHWIPVEPTPGYPIPYSTQTAWQWATTQARMLAATVLAHPITASISILAIWLCIALRAHLVTGLMLAWWSLVRLFWPRGLLKATCQLIDLRFWFAGDRRPDSATVPAWYVRVEPYRAGNFFELWNAKNYSDSSEEISKAEVVRSCQNSINSLTLKRIRDFAILARKENNS